MKVPILSIFFWLFAITSVIGQDNKGLDCWSFGYGKSGTPGDYLHISLELSQSAKSAYYIQSGYEFSHYSGIQYSSLNLGFGYRYYLYGSSELSSKKKLNLMAAIGAVGQLEWEPNLYKDLTLSGRSNYGGFGQVLGEYYFDKTLGFFICGEQKYLFNKTLGKNNYNIFFGLRIHFGGERLP